MKSALVTWIVVLCGFAVHAQVVGKIFPDMEAENVEDKKVKLPSDVKGKYTLARSGLFQKSEDELNTWFQPVFEKFVQKTSGLLASFSYDVNVYFVPMFTGKMQPQPGLPNEKRLKILIRSCFLTSFFTKGS